MTNLFTTWLVYSAIGILLALFPAFILFSSVVSKAVMQNNKDVPSWIIRLSNGNPKTRKWDLFPYRSIKAESRAAKITALVWTIVSLAISQVVIIRFFSITAIANVSDSERIATLVVQELSFPIFTVATTYLPYFLTKRYVNKLGQYDKKTAKARQMEQQKKGKGTQKV